MKKTLLIVLSIIMILSMAAMVSADDNKVVIYHCLSSSRADPIFEQLKAKFPEYEIQMEYMGLSELAAKLKNEGTDTDIDIALDLGYVYMEDMKDLWADHSEFDASIFADFMQVEDKAWMPWTMYSGCVAVNMDVMADKGLEAPASWEDLTKPEYKGLIQMPNPASSGTGYIFLKMLAELWGPEKAFDYFDALAPNVLAFTSSGSAPLKALVEKEAGIALCMTYQAANKIAEGVNLQIVEVEGGHPWTSDGTAIIKGHETDAVKAVFNYLFTDVVYADAKIGPEHGLAAGDEKIPGFPENIVYAEMGEDTLAAKQELLEQWMYE